MKPSIRLVALMLTSVACMVFAAAPAAAQGKEPSADEVQKITAAAAQVQPQVKPEKPRKLLVFSVAYGFWHTAIPYGKKAVEVLGAKTGAFEATVSDDLANFEPEKLKEFDAVFFNNTNEEIFLPADFGKLAGDAKEQAVKRDANLKKSLAAFIASGKGLAAIHAAVNSFRQWPEFGEILGARFDNHPWGAGSTVTLKIDDPTHPVARAFKGRPFTVTDEIYQVKDPYSRQVLRVLVSIDAAKTNMKVQGINRKDGDFGMTWVKSYGQGRVFYNALGHEHNLFWNPTVLQHFLDGIQFALGDLKGDTTPSAKTAK
jgi:type 1 glutamine amidotransferase